MPNCIIDGPVWPELCGHGGYVGSFMLDDLIGSVMDAVMAARHLERYEWVVRLLREAGSLIFIPKKCEERACLS